MAETRAALAHHRFCTALAEYVRRGGEMHISSTREGDVLAVRLVLEDADEYHGVLEALSRELIN
jgi:hypothetical protein